MIAPKDFCSALKKRGFTFLSGVPCSLLTDILNYIYTDKEITYIPVPREDAALGIASGAALCGQKGGILIQNSGLGNIINGLTSFNLIYHLPLLMIITWRGFEGKDAPEHLIMGAKMTDFLDLLNIPYRILSASNYEESLNFSIDSMEKEHKPVALILKEGVIG
ncbi:MAG: thiamine pyrophosphate-binding protein [bacterium]